MIGSDFHIISQRELVTSFLFFTKYGKQWVQGGENNQRTLPQHFSRLLAGQQTSKLGFLFPKIVLVSGIFASYNPNHQGLPSDLGLPLFCFPYKPHLPFLSFPKPIQIAHIIIISVRFAINPSSCPSYNLFTQRQSKQGTGAKSISY